MDSDGEDRLDKVMSERGISRSRTSAKKHILAGHVLVDGVIEKDPAKIVGLNVSITLKEDDKYVSRAGEKLDYAITYFGIDVRDSIVLDVGSSTGGFVDRMLIGGARLVYAVDVGTDQLAQKIKDDARVKVYEQTDIRDIDNLIPKPNFATIDVSFISLKHVLPSVKKICDIKSDIIMLIKPQFEMPDRSYLKNGIIKDPNYHNMAIDSVKRYCEENGMSVVGVVESPILGGSGNKEFLLYAKCI